jgi:hypothetical protein
LQGGKSLPLVPFIPIAKELRMTLVRNFILMVAVLTALVSSVRADNSVTANQPAAGPTGPVYYSRGAAQQPATSFVISVVPVDPNAAKPTPATAPTAAPATAAPAEANKTAKAAPDYSVARSAVQAAIYKDSPRPNTQVITLAVPGDPKVAAAPVAAVRGATPTAETAPADPVQYRLVEARANPYADCGCNGQCGGNSCDGCCQKTCDNQCGCCNKYCDSLFEHRTGAFGEYLYLRAFNADMAHARQENVSQQGPGTVPFGEVGVLQPQFESTFRVGGELACCDCSGIRAAYMQYDTSTSNTLLTAPGIGGTATSLVLAPGTVTAGTTFSQILADYSINFRTADIEYSVLIAESNYAGLNFDVGARYGHLDQGFSQLAQFAQPLGDRQTTTDIVFDGGGLRTGLDGQWRLCKSRITAYGKGYANFLFGEFSSRYSQVNVTTTDLEALSHWDDSRVVTVLETEFGVGWTSCSGCLHVSGGWYSAFWLNTVSTAKYIQAVQNSVFTDAHDSIAFTGLVARAEARF